MSDVARKNQRKSRRGCRRNQRGGNVGAGYAVVPTPVDPTHPFIGNSARIDNITSCRAQTPGYYITNPPPPHGLPGMYGGAKKRRAQRSRRSQRRRNHNVMMGGAYTFNLTSEPNANGAALQQGSYPEVQKLGCQGTIINPLNPGPHTGSNPTPGAVDQWSLGADIAVKMNSDQFYPARVQGGGAYGGTGNNYLDLQAIPGTPGGTGSPFLTSPTAGYTNSPSTWRDSVGAPVELQIPYAARTMNPACIKTGGRRRTNRRNRKANRKNTRRNRRNTRK